MNLQKTYRFDCTFEYITQVSHNDDLVIRLEKEDEYQEVENLVLDSFWNVYRPGCLEHYVLNQLRNDSAFVPELDYSLQKAAELGCGALCFEGNVDFYGKS